MTHPQIKAEDWDVQFSKVLSESFQYRNGELVSIATGHLKDFIRSLLAARDAAMRRTIEERIDYYTNKSTDSGWTGNQSGECCEKCAMSNPKDPLQAVVGCRNPFQLETVCQCHLPTRTAVKNGIVSALEEVCALITNDITK